jgi:hypothetical protein
MEKFEKGKTYSREEIESAGLYLYKELSSRISFFKKEGTVYIFEVVHSTQGRVYKFINISE